MLINIKSLAGRNKPIMCCTNNGIWLSPRDTDQLCLQIVIHNHDPYFNTIRCMNYVRSAPALRSDCTLGPKEQVRTIL